jgi:hypothetical protein
LSAHGDNHFAKTSGFISSFIGQQKRGQENFETVSAMNHIENVVLQHPELAEKYGQLGGLYERK